MATTMTLSKRANAGIASGRKAALVAQVASPAVRSRIAPPVASRRAAFQSAVATVQPVRSVVTCAAAPEATEATTSTGTKVRQDSRSGTHGKQAVVVGEHHVPNRWSRS